MPNIPIGKDPPKLPPNVNWRDGYQAKEDTLDKSNPPQGGSGVSSVFDRYDMCENQQAQIDCRLTVCLFHHDGKCINSSPAITLNDIGTFNCWSQK